MADNPSDGTAQQALLRCLQEAQRVDIEPGPFPPRHDVGRAIEWFELFKGGVRLTGDCVDAFSDVLDALERDRRIGYEFSLKTIMERLRSFLLGAVFGESNFDRKNVGAEMAWNALKARFGEKHTLASYFVPIVNLELSGIDEIVIGVVRIYPNSPSATEKIKASLAEIIRGSPRYTEEEQERHIESMSQQAQPPPGCCVAELTLKVHPDRGYELAAAAARESVAILRLLALFFAGPGPHPIPALLGEVAQGERVQTRLAPGQEFGIQAGLVGVGPIVPFRLTQQVLDDMRGELDALGAAVVPSLPQRLDIQNRLSTALLWYSDAIVEPEVNGKFLKFCIALESLLLDREDEAIATKLAQSVAVLLTDDSNRRLANDRFLRDIYRVRSRIAHEGKDMRARRYVDRVESVAAASILRVAHLAHEERVGSGSDLGEWVKQRLYE